MRSSQLNTIKVVTTTAMQFFVKTALYFRAAFPGKVYASLLSVFILLFIHAFAFAQWTTSGSNIYNSNTGNVGIGVLSPAAKLEATSAALSSVTGSVSEMARFSTSTSNYSQLRIFMVRSATGSDWTTAPTRVQAFTDLTGQGYMDFNPAGGQYGLALGTGGTELMRFSLGGNIGIGTTTPATKLDITTNTLNDGIYFKYNTSGFIKINPNSFGAGAYNNLTQAGDAGIVFGGTAAGAGTIGFVIAPWSNGLSGFRVDNNGNVGIATANTNGYQLAVNGSAIFTKAVVKLYANWPDYVFMPSYKLPVLKDLETYIHSNHHLPGVPTDSTVKKDGVDLGAVQLALLKKIEELTLYIIEQNKQMENLSKRVARIEKNNIL